MERTKVLIADDHGVVREGLTALLQMIDDIDVVGVAMNGVDAVEKTKKLLPDVILMDLRMPIMNGIEATHQIKRKFPHIGIIALTIEEEQQHIVDFVFAGATGYLLKDSDPSQIIKAIRTIARGDSLIHPSIASKILAEFSLLADKKAQKRPLVDHDLTEREMTVLRLVASGQSNKEVANSLELSEKTVKNHLRIIFQKLHVYDRTQACVLAIRRGIIPFGKL